MEQIKKTVRVIETTNKKEFEEQLAKVLNDGGEILQLNVDTMTMIDQSSTYHSYCAIIAEDDKEKIENKEEHLEI